MPTHEYIHPKGAKIAHFNTPFLLESGAVLPELQLAYHSYGQLNAERDNVIWVCHTFTGNSEAAVWWSGFVGAGCALDTDTYFVVCCNVLGSYYGSSSPRFVNPDTNEPYGLSFPICTVRDVVNSQVLLYHYLQLKGIRLAIGGSFGAHQVLELAFTELPIRHLCLMANSARETAWSIVVHEAQRMALETDPSFYQNSPRQDNRGIRTARAIGLLTYRSIESYIARQTDEDLNKTDNFKAASYARYQGEKLDLRFHIHCYWYLSKCLDTHNVGRGRVSIEAALQQITIPTTVISISNDMLIPPSEQQFLARHIPNASFFEITSDFGHDGFLLEIPQLTVIIKEVLRGE